MTRSPKISDERYNALVDKVRGMGYDVTQMRRVPHNP